MIPKEQRTKRARQLFDAPHAKPPYRVPLMAEVARVKWNGLTVVTTFAGCGGSSLGYRMAGYRVLWANEFVPIAQESYRANMRKGTIVDGRDIQKVTAEDILKATGLAQGELDVLDGSPPCQAFSTAGLREKGWGTDRKYAHGAEQKNEELFWEYIRLLEGLRPRAFIAENVSGLVKGAAKGYFLEILSLMKSKGYRVGAQVVDAQWLGVPQQRQRVIFVGVREDLEREPAFPVPLPYRYSVRDALPWLGRVVEEGHGFFQGHDLDAGEGPHPTIRAGNGDGGRGHQQQVVDHCVSKNQNAAFPHKNKDYPTDEVAPTVMARRSNLDVGIEYRGRPGAKGWRPGVAAETRRQSLDKPSQPITGDGYAAGGRHQAHIVFRGGPGGAPRREKIGDVDQPGHTVSAKGYGAAAINQTALVERLILGPNTNFGRKGDVDEELPAPTIVAGDARKRIPQQFEIEQMVQGPEVDFKNHGNAIDMDAPSPAVAAGNADRRTPRQFQVEVRKVGAHDTVPENVAAGLEGYAIGREYDRLNPGQASDKYLSLVRADASKPSPTITAEGGSTAGRGVPGGVAAVCHPTEKRKFTIAELKRLCAFPDDFVLLGTYAQQWERLGNSVPPVMMRAIAEAVRDGVLLPARAADARSSKSIEREARKGRASHDRRKSKGEEPSRA